MSKATVLFLLLPEYAEWEPALLAAGLRFGFGEWEGKYEVKTVAPGPEEVMSVGGFRTVPDYTFANAPEDFAALVLVGGMSWRGEGAKAVLPLVRRTLEKGAVLGAICDASLFLGISGFLNEVEHTSNSLSHIQELGGSVYTGASRYHADKQSVRDGNIVTATGTGFIEFACDMFAALDAAPQEKIVRLYTAFKSGFFPV